MEVNSFISAIEGIEELLQNFLNVIIFIAKFLFLSVWGWIILAIVFISMVVVKIRNRNNQITFTSAIGGMAETLFWFYTTITSIIIGLFLVLILSLVFTGIRDLTDSLKLFKQVKMLESTLKNLKSERKLVKVTAQTLEVNGTNRINVVITYYAYSPVQETDIETGQKVFVLDGKKLYIDFGVINFKYSLIEKGEAINIAFPYKLFSDTLPYNDGLNILNNDGNIPLTFKLEANDLYLLNQQTYEDYVKEIIGCATNLTLSRELGLKTTYGQSISLTPQTGKTYEIYSTAVGGIVLK